MRFFVASESVAMVTSKSSRLGQQVKRTGTRQPAGQLHAVPLADRERTLCGRTVEDLNEFQGRDFETEAAAGRCPVCNAAGAKA